MKQLGFEYKRISKVSTPVDSVSFMAQRAKYFAKHDEVRSNGSLIFYHDETWTNIVEENRMTWFDPNTGSGRLGNNDTKGETHGWICKTIDAYILLLGTQITISALLSESRFHLPSVDIFECQEDHIMDGDNFVERMLRTASLLRLKYGTVIPLMTLSLTDLTKISGQGTKICAIIGNATWYNRLTEQMKPPKRAWNKRAIIDWLNAHQVNYPESATKAELLEIAFQNASERKYIVDEAVKIYDIQIIR